MSTVTEAGISRLFSIYKQDINKHESACFSTYRIRVELVANVMVLEEVGFFLQKNQAVGELCSQSARLTALRLFLRSHLYESLVF